jgi:hypothetical protein
VDGEHYVDTEEEDGDLFSGPKEMLEQSQAVKKSIQYNLGRRSGPRWSLPHQYIGTILFGGAKHFTLSLLFSS